jgi:hypothetical protein
LTVAGTFRLAIKQATVRYPLAKTLISYLSLLPLVDIPCFLFTENADEFSTTLSDAIVGEGFDKMIGELRAYALIDRYVASTIGVNPITVDCVRLHRLVREVAAATFTKEECTDAMLTLTRAVYRSYPPDHLDDRESRIRANQLRVIAFTLLSCDVVMTSKYASHEINTLLARIAKARILQFYTEKTLKTLSEHRAETDKTQNGVFVNQHNEDNASTSNDEGISAFIDLIFANTEHFYDAHVHEASKGYMENENLEPVDKLIRIANVLQSAGDVVYSRLITGRVRAVEACRQGNSTGPDPAYLRDDQ